MRSNMLQNLLVCMKMGSQFRVVSDLAFDALDEDGSGQLDDSEIALIMQQVAESMGVQKPTDEDIKAILQELDDDFDGQVSKEEFYSLVILVVGKLLESELELLEKINQEIIEEEQLASKNQQSLEDLPTAPSIFDKRPEDENIIKWSVGKPKK